jgi:predicted TIM-barrel fold metal-dependent hydrolase
MEPLWTAIEEFVHLEGVSDKSKSKILWDNCARLYHLAGAA